MKNLLPGKNAYEKLMTFVGTGFGFGIAAPVAPGTIGSAPGVALAFATTLLPWQWQIPLCIVLAIAAIPFCDVAEKVFGVKDDGRIVADEWMLYPLALIGIPQWELLTNGHWWLIPVFFVVIRAFDIVKLPPAYQLQRLHGGFGIMIDDFAANLYSLGANWLIYWFFCCR